MEIPRHQGMLFAGGLLVGTIVGAGVLLGVYEHLGAGKPAAGKQAAAAPAPEVSRTLNCGFAPVLTAAAKGDGLFALPADPRDATAADSTAYVAVGRDAAAQGRVRDAEVAFITSCRMAGPSDTSELAEAKYQLASHYVTLSATDNAARGEALARARTLMSESVTLYGARLGLDDARTRQAAAGLLALERATAPGEQPLEVPRVLLAERAQYDEMAAAAASSPGGITAARSGPQSVTTTAMGGPPAARKKEPARPRAREDETDSGESAASSPAPASGEAQARPAAPGPSDEAGAP